jgi:hypothetical protein
MRLPVNFENLIWVSSKVTDLPPSTIWTKEHLVFYLNFAALMLAEFV